MSGKELREILASKGILQKEMKHARRIWSEYPQPTEEEIIEAEEKIEEKIKVSEPLKAKKPRRKTR